MRRFRAVGSSILDVMLIMYSHLVNGVGIDEPALGRQQRIQPETQVKSIAEGAESAKIAGSIVRRDVQPPDVKGVIGIEMMGNSREQKILYCRTFERSFQPRL